MIELHGPEYPNASGGIPKQLIVFLHGLGADGNDLISLASDFAEVLPEAYFVSPHAPFPCDMAPSGYQWFSLRNWSLDSLRQGAAEAVPILERYIAHQLKKHSLTENDLAFVGFSQGTMTSLYYSLVYKQPSCRGVLGYSGAFVGDRLQDFSNSPAPKICLIHGTLDMVVPYQAMLQAKATLEAAATLLETHSRPGLGHGIDLEGIEIGKRFLQKLFAK
ncbi:MAG: hypothetical protein Q8O19_02505 [Rectinemataceae bacterium]|nr:hypothetical protein [Rectinemataceae bacterium]